MIAQHTTGQDTVEFTFTVSRREHAKALALAEELAKGWGNVTVKTNAKVAKLSLVGIGMRSHTGVATTMFKALGDANIGVQMITTSEIKISVILEEALLEKAIKVIHQAFELDKINTNSEKALTE
jgi:aspartate kinase